MAGIIRRLTHLRVLVNARYTLAPVTGVQRYAHALVSCLDVELRLAAPRRIFGTLGGHMWEQMVLPGNLRRGEILLSPANTGPLRVRDQLVIIHDLAVLDHPEWFDRRFAAWYRFLLPRLASSARRILTVSEHSKDRIQAVLNVPDERIAVIYPGVNPELFSSRVYSQDQLHQKYGVGPRFLLWVGALEARKNLPRLLAAWSQAALRLHGVQLVLVGAPRSGFQLPLQLNLPPGVLYIGFVEDCDLGALYAGALALILPSLEEGFGLPVLEAMACGAPVIASNTIGAAEVLGEDLLLIDPVRVGEISAAIERIAADEELRQSLSRRGQDRARSFTWEHAASMVVPVLQAVAEEAALK